MVLDDSFLLECYRTRSSSSLTDNYFSYFSRSERYSLGFSQYGVLRKLKHIFPNTYQRIKSICSPAKGGTGCYRFNYQPGS